MARLKRSLIDIRTLSGRVDYASIPYRTYLKVSCLEMEKARLGKETDSLTQRMSNIKVRLEEIEAEERDLLERGDEIARDRRGTVAEPQAEPTSRKSRPTFRLKY